MPRNPAAKSNLLNCLFSIALLTSSFANAGGLSVTLDPFVSNASIGGTPLYITHANDASGRLFIMRQDGVILIRTSGGTILPTPFLNIGTTGLNLIVSGGERGLLGLAFHPNFASNRRFFVSYTRTGDGASVISRFTASVGDPNVADTASRFDVMGPIAQPQANHNGGCIQFGPDGMLFFALGDGGGANDTGTGHTTGLGNGQDPTNLLGDILRIDVDGAPDAGLNYHIPTDNPFFVTGPVPSTRQEIYAWGFRNPWRFSFDSMTGDLFAGDVGQGNIEEVDIVTAGGNFGWRRMEGTACFNPASGCQTGSLILPITEYTHASGNCSITGGYVYRGTDYPPMQGRYFYADYCSGRIWSAEEVTPGTWVSTLALDTSNLITSFGEDADGELYVCTDGGGIFAIVGPVPVELSGAMLE